MPGAVRITLPADLADEVVQAGEGVRSFTTRGPMVDAVHLVLNAASTADSAVTVAIAAAAMPKVARRVAEKVRRADPTSTGRVVVGLGAEQRTIELPTDLSLDAATDRIKAALFGDAGDNAGPPSQD